MMLRDEFHEAFAATEIVRGRILHDIKAGVLDVPAREWKFGGIYDDRGLWSPRIFIMRVFVTVIVKQFQGRIDTSPASLSEISRIAAASKKMAWIEPERAAEAGILPNDYGLQPAWVRNGFPDISASTGVSFLWNRLLETIIPVPAVYSCPKTGTNRYLNDVVVRMLTGQSIPCAGDAVFKGQWMKRLYVIPEKSINRSFDLWYSKPEIQNAALKGNAVVKPMPMDKVVEEAKAHAAECAPFLDPGAFVSVRRAGFWKRGLMRLVCRDALLTAKNVIQSRLFKRAVPMINLVGSRFDAESWPVSKDLLDAGLDERSIQGLMLRCVDDGASDVGAVYAPDDRDDRLTLLLAIMTLVETGVYPRYADLRVWEESNINWTAILAALANYAHGGDTATSPDGWYAFSMWVRDVDRADLYIENVLICHRHAVKDEERPDSGCPQGPEVVTLAESMAVGRKINEQR